MRSLGLYIHIPFCRRKCLYCDFCSLEQQGDAEMEAYADAVCRDLARWATQCRDRRVNTVYFGGGTPSLLPPSLLLRMLESIARLYHVENDAEITLECNPATGSAESFSTLRRGGFNRISVGLQSTHENELRALGRIHTFADFERTYADLREAGFENISADLMSGIPEQTVESYLESIRRLCALSPEHISAYGLSVEEETPFGRMGDRLSLPDEETARQMYFEGIGLLASLGYRQYEISNYAKRGYESRHNLKYWNCEEYLGFGPAAYSDFNGDRFGNSRDVAAYIHGREILAERETPSPSERMNEYIMLRMRLTDGVSAAAFSKRFGQDLNSLLGGRLAAFESGGFVRRTEDGWAFTTEGFYVSNTILAEILDFSS